MNLLEEVVLDLERHAVDAGWDAPPRLYALVQSSELCRQEPGLAEQLELDEDVDTIAALEQGELPEADSIEETLARIAWPSSVTGCALVIERVVLPPGVEEEMPEDEDAAVEWAASHPQREDVRMVVGVLRDGERHSALRLRHHDADDEVLSGPDLVPALADALAATLEPDLPDEDETDG
nr:PPA1309 family protein [Thermomonospora umbrina]